MKVSEDERASSLSSGFRKSPTDLLVTRDHSDRVHALDATRFVCWPATTFPVRQPARVGPLGGAGRTAPGTSVAEWTRRTSTRRRRRRHRGHRRSVWIIRRGDNGCATHHAPERSRPRCCSGAVNHSRSRRGRCRGRRSARNASSSSTGTTSQNARPISPCRRRTRDGASG